MILAKINHLHGSDESVFAASVAPLAAIPTPETPPAATNSATISSNPANTCPPTPTPNSSSKYYSCCHMKSYLIIKLYGY